MDTVRVEYMLVNEQGLVLTGWATAEGGLFNDPQTYVYRAHQVRDRYTQGMSKARVRVVSEQTGRIVDIIQ
jgi:hypothetical protein